MARLQVESPRAAMGMRELNGRQQPWGMSRMWYLGGGRSPSGQKEIVKGGATFLLYTG